MIQTKHFSKILLTLFVCLPLSTLKANNLSTADSLFNQRSFSKALSIYEELYVTNEYSPAMLLRMANIYERKGELAYTLHYLTQYYQLTGESSALFKMRDLAGANNFTGYEFEDIEYLQTLIARYQKLITLILLALNFLLLALIFVRKYRFKQQPLLSIVFQLVLIILLGVSINYQAVPDRGILTAKTTYFMQGPSPGADLADIASGNHRLTVIGKQDAWLKVVWQDEVVYVKAHQVLLGKQG